jgi:hypothetical protein
VLILALPQALIPLEKVPISRGPSQSLPMVLQGLWWRQDLTGVDGLNRDGTYTCIYNDLQLKAVFSVIIK